MQEYNPLSDDVMVLCEDDEPIQVKVDSVAARLSKNFTGNSDWPMALFGYDQRPHNEQCPLFHVEIC